METRTDADAYANVDTCGIGLAAPVSSKEDAALTGGEDGSVSINTCASSSLQAGNKERAL